MRTRPSAWWSTTPGSSILTPTNATPPSARSGPSAAAIRPTFSIAVLQGQHGRADGAARPPARRAAARVSCDFVVTIARSAGPGSGLGAHGDRRLPRGARRPRARPPSRAPGGLPDAVPAPPSSPRARRGPAARRSTSPPPRRPSRGLMPAEPSSPGGRLLVEEDGPALILRMSNPGRANALDEAILDALASLLHAPPPAARAVLLGGDGDRHFSAGLDVGGAGRPHRAHPRGRAPAGGGRRRRGGLPDPGDRRW